LSDTSVIESTVDIIGVPGSSDSAISFDF